MIVYAPTIERFVLIHPVENFNTDVYLYEPENETWERRPIVGPTLTADRPPMGYFNPRFNVVVLQQKSASTVWLYRP